MEQLRERNRRLGQVAKDLQDSEIEVKSRDRLVTVVTSTNGEILSVRLDRELFRHAEPGSVERAVLATIQSAQSAAKRVTEEAIQKVIPSFSFASLLENTERLSR